MKLVGVCWTSLNFQLLRIKYIINLFVLKFAELFGGYLGNSAAALFRHHTILKHYADSNGRIKTDDKYAIQPRSSDVTYLAGLYRIEESRDLKYPVFAVLTRTPTDDLREIHDRMPLILPERAIDEWISPNGEPNKVIDAMVKEVVVERTV